MLFIRRHRLNGRGIDGHLSNSHTNSNLTITEEDSEDMNLNETEEVDETYNDFSNI